MKLSVATAVVSTANSITAVSHFPWVALTIMDRPPGGDTDDWQITTYVTENRAVAVKTRTLFSASGGVVQFIARGVADTQIRRQLPVLYVDAAGRRLRVPSAAGRRLRVPSTPCCFKCPLYRHAAVASFTNLPPELKRCHESTLDCPGCLHVRLTPPVP